MARLRNIKSGAVVSVSDEKADRMGGEWEQADKPASTKSTAKKSSSSNSK